MAMSRRNYVAVAAIIADEVAAYPTDPIAQTVIRNFAERMADTFEEDNARFDRERFLTACGLGE